MPAKIGLCWLALTYLVSCTKAPTINKHNTSPTAAATQQMSIREHLIPCLTAILLLIIMSLPWNGNRPHSVGMSMAFSTRLKRIPPRREAGFPYPAPFDQRFYLILNVAVGGNWPGNPDNTTSFPQRMAVDYVRVFQRND